jgi:GNAT superfamily N-acetyltransferase
MKTPMEIRFAKPEDTPTILRFVRELAAFEKLEHEMVGTEALLHEDLFGAKPMCEVILAFDGETPVGFALFFHNYSTFLTRKGLYLEDLYVTPSARGTGLGKQLLQFLAKIAVERGCGRMEWWVLDWNQRAIEFYKSLGAQPMDEWTVFRLDQQEFTDLAHR